MIITQEERNHLNSLPPAFRNSLTSAREATKKIAFGNYALPEGNSLVEKLKNNWIILSVWAFLFWAIPYFIRGMWKKALLVMIAYFVITIALALIVASVSNPITAEANVSTLTGYMWLFFSVYFGLSYKSDCYRKFVLKENFWI